MAQVIDFTETKKYQTNFQRYFLKPVGLSFVSAVGRCKSATSRVVLQSGTGQIEVNGRPLKSYLQFNDDYIDEVEAPLKLFSTKYDVFVKVSGGGIKGQPKAIKLAIARALVSGSWGFAQTLKPEVVWRMEESTFRTFSRIIDERKKRLKAFGYLTRDARSKERKKYGLRKARKAPQFSKR
jgi:small subunit ribosomal protein S9